MTFGPSSLHFLHKGGNLFLNLTFTIHAHKLASECRTNTGLIRIVKRYRIEQHNDVWGWDRVMLCHRSRALILIPPTFSRFLARQLFDQRTYLPLHVRRYRRWSMNKKYKNKISERRMCWNGCKSFDCMKEARVALLMHLSSFADVPKLQNTCRQYGPYIRNFVFFRQNSSALPNCPEEKLGSFFFTWDDCNCIAERWE